MKACSNHQCGYGTAKQPNRNFYKNKNAKDGLESECTLCLKLDRPLYGTYFSPDKGISRISTHHTLSFAAEQLGVSTAVIFNHLSRGTSLNGYLYTFSNRLMSAHDLLVSIYKEEGITYPYDVFKANMVDALFMDIYRDWIISGCLLKYKPSLKDFNLPLVDTSHTLPHPPTQVSPTHPSLPVIHICETGEVTTVDDYCPHCAFSDDDFCPHCDIKESDIPY